MVNVKKTYCVLGLSNFGRRMATSLYELGFNVVVVDHNERLTQKIAPNVTKAICADVMDWDVMDHLGVPLTEVAIIGLPHDFDVTVLLVLYLNKAKVPEIIAQVSSEEKAEALMLMGVDRVVWPEKDIADRLVKQLAVPSLVEQISISPDIALIEVPCTENFIGKTLIDLKIRQKYNLYIIGLKRQTQKMQEPLKTIIAPRATMRFQKNDILLALGNTKDLVEFTKDIGLKAEGNERE